MFPFNININITHIAVNCFIKTQLKFTFQILDAEGVKVVYPANVLGVVASATGGRKLDFQKK